MPVSDDTTEEVTEAESPLQRLAEFAADSPYDRLVLRPGRVTADGPMGMEVVDFKWDLETHSAAMEAFSRSVEYGDWLASWVGDGLVMKRVTPSENTLEDWVSAGLLSSLAARMIAGSLASGRNVLIAGADSAAAGLALALGEQSLRPALMGGHDVPTPSHWVRAHTLQDIAQLGADRLVVVGGRDGGVVDALFSHNGVIASIDSRRLDRALMRFELALAQKVGADQAPLAVLASIDLVIVLDSLGSGHVAEVVELQYGEAGYCPVVLMCRGVEPMPEALVPIQAPGFLDELASLGLEGMAADYQNALPPEIAVPTEPEVPAYAAEPEPDPEPVYEIQIPIAEPKRMRLPKMGAVTMRANPADLRNGVVLPPPGMGPPGQGYAKEPAPTPLVEREDVPPPGWELDQLPDELVGEETHIGSSDDAVMAATYGLAPPPAPRTQSADDSGHDLEELLEAVRRHGSHEDQEQN